MRGSVQEQCSITAGSPLLASHLSPCSCASAARWFPSASRSRWTSAVYSAYSVGTVAGLALTPLLAEVCWWVGVLDALEGRGQREGR